MAKRRKRAKTPQPPPPPPVAAPAADYGLQYNPTIESQLNQPYQDILAAGATGALPNVFTNLGGQQQLTPLFGGQAAGTLGQYGQMIAPNPQIIAGWQKELQDIQAGKADFDPFLTQQFNDQEMQLRQQLQRQLGPDYENSSAGIEALSKFNQYKTTSLGSAQFQRGTQLSDLLQNAYQSSANQALGLGTQYGQGTTNIYNQTMGLRGSQLGGAAQMLGNTATTMDLYGTVPKTMGQFGQAMGQMSGYDVTAQGPYQQDRLAQLSASYAPTKGQYIGEMMGQTGKRWQQVGSSIGGMGGGASSAGASAGSQPGAP
jgi:hypothetical protein